MRVAIVVPGRFHTFDLSRALLTLGHDVTVFTNYPAWAAARFGVPPGRVRSFWPHGVASRLIDRLPRGGGRLARSGLLQRAFGGWAARAVAGRWDLIYAMSGVAEELLRAPDVVGPKVVARGSSHIRAQARLLREEASRARCTLDAPGAWIIAREEREYALADQVCVLSAFARRTFLEEGVAARRVSQVVLALPVERFRPPQPVIRARRERLRAAAEPLRILTIGHVSFRKGLLDLLEVARRLPLATFRLVGPVLPEARSLARDLPPNVVLLPPCAHERVVEHLAWGDLFFLPTIEDGFGVVLAEALAAGLPILTTTNSGGPDLLAMNEHYGWVVPIRNPGAAAALLAACETDRAALADRCDAIVRTPPRRTWADVAAEVVGLGAVR